MKLVAAFAAVAGVAALIVWWGSHRFDAGTSALVSGLGVPRAVPELFRSSMLDGLPLPVERYLRLVFREGHRLADAAVVRQHGEFRLDSSETGWRKFEATQHFRASPPGFVWDARIHMAPLLDVRVRDAYVRGRGSMHARLFAVVPLVSQEDRKELDLGALQRFLAEAVWLPSALLPGRGVEWRGLDERSAVATLRDSGTEVSLTFRFDEGGRIAEVFAEERFREVSGDYVPTPWRGTFRAYDERGGILVPVEAEVEWILPEGRHPYWRGRIESIEYDPEGGSR